MFKRRTQLAEVCRILTKDVTKSELWTRDGPTAQARALYDDDTAKVSASQRTMLEMAFWLWGEGERGPHFGTVVQLLDRRRLHRVGSLLTAMADGNEAIDRWIRANGGFVGDA